MLYIMGEGSMNFPRETVTVWMATAPLQSKGQESDCHHMLLLLLLLLLIKRVVDGLVDGHDFLNPFGTRYDMIWFFIH